MDNPVNENSKRRSKPADGIVIHSMGEYVGDQYAPDFLHNIGLSAHYFITPDGLVVYGVDHDRIAYHAGESKLGDEEDLNNTFIGIEILIQGKHNWGSFVTAIKDPNSFHNIQYERTAEICDNLMDIYPDITYDRIVEHSEVSGPDVRKNPKIDPGEGFDMEKLKDMI